MNQLNLAADTPKFWAIATARHGHRFLGAALASNRCGECVGSRALALAAGQAVLPDSQCRLPDRNRVSGLSIWINEQAVGGSADRQQAQTGSRYFPRMAASRRSGYNTFI